jgi:hypothetical protein
MLPITHWIGMAERFGLKPDDGKWVVMCVIHNRHYHYKSLHAADKFASGVCKNYCERR